MSESSLSINLIKDKQIPFVDKFMNWALTVGRLIVIITEIVAIGAFLYRFSLDEKLVDLHSTIKQKQNFILLLKQDENKYRDVQERLALASSFSDISNKTYKSFQDIINLTPKNVKFTNFALNKDRMNISLNATSISLLNDFVNLLRGYPDIKSVSIDNIESKISGISFNITAVLK